jgi:hypothetical protein
MNIHFSAGFTRSSNHRRLAHLAPQSRLQLWACP